MSLPNNLLDLADHIQITIQEWDGDQQFIHDYLLEVSAQLRRMTQNWWASTDQERSTAHEPR